MIIFWVCLVIGLIMGGLTIKNFLDVFIRGRGSLKRKFKKFNKIFPIIAAVAFAVMKIISIIFPNKSSDELDVLDEDE